MTAQPKPSKHLLDTVRYPEGFNLGHKKPDSFNIWNRDTFTTQIMTRTETYEVARASWALPNYTFSMSYETGTPKALGKFIQLDSRVFPIFPGELHISRPTDGKHFIYDTLYSISTYKPYNEDFYIYENGTYVKTVRVNNRRITFLEVLDLSNAKYSLRYEFYKKRPFSVYSRCRTEIGKGSEIVYFDKKGIPFSNKKAMAKKKRKEKQLKRILKRNNIKIPDINDEPLPDNSKL